ncbi:protein-glutamate O-methyltransferase CheR [soil metagenome]
MGVVLTDEEFRLFGEWLAEEYGLRFGPERRDILRVRLDPRRAELGFDSFEQLYFHLKFHPERAAERQRLLPHLTNNESYFFRERPQLHALRDEVLPAIRRRLLKESRREVRLLSAGCAAGEEPFTLAMIARGTGLFPPPWTIRVTGVDLDPRALERAQGARYSEHAFRGVEPELREQHFRRDGEQWEVIPTVRSLVEFRQGNLVEPAWTRDLPPQDVIFCRNVLIYFDNEGITRATRVLYDALIPGGYLFLGHAESLSRIPTRFAVVRRPGAIFHCRPHEE